ncbi:ABC transporter ATP-binding protein/permease [Bacillus amyloliquefaciens]|nr:ABC transporter ATP-binding protein/permease [Bacillus amyloliquefaciens]
MISRITNDINIVSNTMTRDIFSIFFTPIMCIASCIYLFFLSWKMALLVSVLGPLIFILGYLFSININKYSSGLFARFGKFNDFLFDSLSGRKMIRLYSLEKTFREKHIQENQSIFNEEKKINKLNAILTSSVGVIANLSFIITIGLGALFIVNGEIKVGTLMAFIILLNYVIEPFTLFGTQISQIAKGLSAAERIHEILDIPNSEQKKKLYGIENLKKGIKIKEMSFSYPGTKKVLDKININISAGSNIGLIGPSGSGKSTLLSILVKLNDYTDGEVLYDGISSNEIRDIDIRKTISYVSQNDHLFNSSIKENILYGNMQASESKIIEVANLVKADEFIKLLPEGYNTLLGNEGVNLSSGQKQRILLARALLKDFSILILDEATSGLDTNTENQVLNNIRTKYEDKTIIVTTHRLTNIQSADEIFVMNEGGISEQGKHSDLLRNKQLYYKLYKQQYNDENYIIK